VDLLLGVGHRLRLLPHRGRHDRCAANERTAFAGSLRGRPPFLPLRRAAAVFASLLREPPRRPMMTAATSFWVLAMSLSLVVVRERTV